MSRRHGRRRHIASDCRCTAKTACYTTWEAAWSAVHRIPDVIRAYRGSCCGHYHVTKYTEDEYAQRVAAYMCTVDEICGIVDHERKDNDHGTEEDSPRSYEQAAARLGLEAGEPGARRRGPRTAPVERGAAARLAPTPLTVAARLQAR